MSRQEKHCYACGKESLSKDEIGLTKKLVGRQTTRFFCIDCLADQLDVTPEELLAKAEEFREAGCSLFQ